LMSVSKVERTVALLYKGIERTILCEDEALLALYQHQLELDQMVVVPFDFMSKTVVELEDGTF
ncbi:MAG: hypothetical protein ACRC1D_08710, partial [Culicoidibacterales bacterium]